MKTKEQKTPDRAPEWMRHTPGGKFDFELTAFMDDCSVQSVPISRDEFEDLKYYLVQLRRKVV
jgi:hypothetical protein